jgi:SAM-dependent methyltransferase
LDAGRRSGASRAAAAGHCRSARQGLPGVARPAFCRQAGVPDCLGNGARTFEDIAQTTGTHPDRMHRLLRVLAAADVVRDLGSGRFELTPVGDCLRADAPNSVRSIALLTANSWPEMEHLDDCIRTGKNAFELRHGAAPFAYLAQHPERAAVFNEDMREFSVSTGAALVQAYDFATAGRVVDVGGGHGTVLASILRAHPHLRGTLLDRADVVAGAPALLAREGVADRCELVAGDMLASVPAGGDVYLLSHIVHDWLDAPARQILEACRAAMTPDARLLIVDRLMPERVEPGPAAETDLLFDLTMMVMMGGRERTAAELDTLLATSGLRLQRTVSLPTPDKLVEAVPA